jgi:uncharacterized protein YecE (DUF72 family)
MSIASVRFRNNEYSIITSGWLITNWRQEPAKAKLASQGSELSELNKLNSVELNLFYYVKKLVISVC